MFGVLVFTFSRKFNSFTNFNITTTISPSHPFFSVIIFIIQILNAFLEQTHAKKNKNKIKKKKCSKGNFWQIVWRNFIVYYYFMTFNGIGVCVYYYFYNVVSIENKHTSYEIHMDFLFDVVNISYLSTPKTINQQNNVKVQIYDDMCYKYWK